MRIDMQVRWDGRHERWGTFLFGVGLKREFVTTGNAALLYAGRSHMVQEMHSVQMGTFLADRSVSPNKLDKLPDSALASCCAAIPYGSQS